MPLFKRKDKAAEPAPGGQPDEVLEAIPTGNAQCLAIGCPNHNATQCRYMDRRGRRCETHWCPDHVRMVASQPYCPRHAGIMTALTLSPKKGHLPDLDNRAPSLANWVGNDMDAGIRKILREVLNEHDAETIIVEPVGYVFTVHDKAHRWERAWKLANHTGVTLKISIDVDEANDSMVRVRVGQQSVTKVVPPWVEHNRKRERIDPATDANERREFYQGVFVMVGEQVGSQRNVRFDRPYIGVDSYGTPASVASPPPTGPPQGQ